MLVHRLFMPRLVGCTGLVAEEVKLADDGVVQLRADLDRSCKNTTIGRLLSTSATKTRGRPKTEKPSAGKPAKKPTVKKPRKKATSRARQPKPRVEPTPGQVEVKKQKRREYDRKRSQAPERKGQMRAAQAKIVTHRKSLGLCVNCGAPSIPAQSRCPTYAERHRVAKRRWQAERKERNKQGANQ